MISLVLGGARSGKSEVGERLAQRWSLAAPDRAAPDRTGPDSGQSRPTVTYVATAAVGDGDAEFDARIARHRARRPAHWTTVEVARGERLSPALAVDGVVLVDSLGTWVAGNPGFAVDVDDLVQSIERRRTHGLATVLVSDEVGLGVHPETQPGLAFRDALGRVNRLIADVAEDVLLVVAGRVLVLDREER